MKINLLLVTCALFSATTFASPDLIIKTERVATPLDVIEQLDYLTFQGRDRSENDDEISWEQIVNIGKQVWKIIQDGQPVLDVKHQYANALPKGLNDSSALDNFSSLQYESYRSYGENLFGAKVFDVTYTVVHRYNGSYKGRGRYLENVTVLPSHVDALWGYTVNFGVDKVSAVNVGTQENPIASLTMEMSFEVSTVIKKSRDNIAFDFRADSARVSRTK